MTQKIQILAVSTALTLLAAWPQASYAQSITFTKVADTDTLIPPENTKTFFGFFEPSIDQGNVAFLGGTTTSDQAIYRWADGVLIEIAGRTTVLPNSGDPPQLVGSVGRLPSIDGEIVALVASDRFRRPGIYIGDGGPLMVVVNTDTQLPGGIGAFNFAPATGFPAWDDGVSAFIATASFFFDLGVYTASRDGRITLIADQNTQMPEGTGTFASFEGISTDQGSVAFRGVGGMARPSDEQGIYKWIDGELTVVADRGTLIPGTQITFDSFGGSARVPVSIDGRDVAFIGNKGAPRFFGVIAEIDGVLEVVVEEGMPTPDGLGEFIGFNTASIDNGNVAFNTTRTPFRSIYLKPAGGNLIKVIDTNDLLDGKEIDSFRFGAEALNGNQIAFVAEFVNDTRGVYIAEFATSPPIADAGPDQTVQCTSPDGASVTLDGSGSFDPDSSPLTYHWSNSFGTVDGVSPTVDLALGSHTITLVVNDGALNSEPDPVDVEVVDTTAPGLVASLAPVGQGDDDDDGDEGRFRVGFSVADVCDTSPTVTAILRAQGCPEMPVRDGQIFEFEFEDEECEVELEDGILEIEAPDLTLVINAADAEGNSVSVQVVPSGLGADNDDERVASAGSDD